MLYIFLDVDGVLNTSSEWKKLYTLNQNCIKAFATFISSQNECKIILSSSWRNGFSYLQKSLPHIEMLKKELGKYSVSIDGKTPLLPEMSREDEIKKYIQLYDVKNYIIIDDDKSLFSKSCKNLYIVNSDTGFTEKDARVLGRLIKS